MSILIQGMEMPKRCFECIFLTTVPNFFCLAGKRDLCAEHGINISRPDWCPLIELPPHGRLGDLDELYKAANMADDFGADTTDILKLIIDTPTVIEAEGET